MNSVREPQTLEAALSAFVTNATLLRNDMLKRAFDPRRNIADECGHPSSAAAVTVQLLQELFDLDSIASRVVEVLPMESWQTNPMVFEKQSAKAETPFEIAWDGLPKKLRGNRSWHKDEEGSIVWESLLRADILSGIGSFGAILLGFNDGLPPSQPLGGVMATNERGRLLYGEKPKTVPIRVVNGSEYQTYSPTATELLGTDAQYEEWGAGTAVPPRAADGKIDLLSMRVFQESLVQIVQFEANPGSPRRGMPVRYAITLNDPAISKGGIGYDQSIIYVHWSRVQHIADNLLSSEVFGRPRMQPVLPRLLDLRKIYGSDAEAFWKNVVMRIYLETHPQLGGDVKVDKAGLKDMMENMENGLQRWAALMGMSAKTIAPTMVDPTPHITTQIEAICIKLGIPKRVFMGSERGELASSQDDQAWNDRLKLRQTSYITPRIIVPFVDRLILAGVLPMPTDGYHVEWPDLTSQSDQDRAAVLVQKSQAYSTYLGGQVNSLIPPMDWMTKFDNLSEEEAAAILQAAKQEAADSPALPAQATPPAAPAAPAAKTPNDQGLLPYQE